MTKEKEQTHTQWNIRNTHRYYICSSNWDLFVRNVDYH